MFSFSTLRGLQVLTSFYDDDAVGSLGNSIIFQSVSVFAVSVSSSLKNCVPLKGLRMHYDQRHAGLCLGRRPCVNRKRVQGCSQGTTLCAPGLQNARATILNPIYKMEYKIIKKMGQKTTWIEADIPDITLTPNRHNVLASAIV